MKATIISLLTLLLFFVISCANKSRSVEEDGGAVVTVKYFDVEKNGETPESILSKLRKRVSVLSDDGKVYYSQVDSTFQINLPEFFSERNLKFLLSKGEVNVNMLWHHSEFDQPHGKRLIAELSKKYKVDRQEADFEIEGINFSEIGGIEKYIKDNKLLIGFPEGTKLYWKAPSVTGRENKVVMFLLSNSPDNFNLNDATDSIEVATVDDRRGAHYTKLFLNKEYTSRYADISDRHVGNLFAISVDQYVVSTPVIESRIDTGVINSLADYDYEGHMVFDALLSTTPIKSPSEIISINIISNHKKSKK